MHEERGPPNVANAVDSKHGWTRGSGTLGAGVTYASWYHYVKRVAVMIGGHDLCVWQAYCQLEWCAVPQAGRSWQTPRRREGEDSAFVGCIKRLGQTSCQSTGGGPLHTVHIKALEQVLDGQQRGGHALQECGAPQGGDLDCSKVGPRHLGHSVDGFEEHLCVAVALLLALVVVRAADDSPRAAVCSACGALHVPLPMLAANY